MTFQIYTLGCKVNTYESNVIEEQLQKQGYQLTDGPADIVIINTCTVTNTADRKSMKMIHRIHKEYPQALLVVIGCMSQIRADEVKELPNVIIVLGNKYKSKLPALIEQYMHDRQPIVLVEDLMQTTFETMRLDNFNRTRAFVKIEDGCENFCSYCIIPYSRGNVRSKAPLDVIDEVKTLVKIGHHEIVLTGIHTGHYGAEFEAYQFADLLRDLLNIPGLERLRISSIEMNEITDEVLQLLQSSSILVDHFHIPLQSGSDSILKAMNRKYDKQAFIEKVAAIRKVRPRISLTTDLIVGFPGETEEYFLETLDTIRHLKFSKIHVFPYSKRQGTKAALLPDIDGTTKKQRVRTVLELSRQLEQEYMTQFLGETVTVIPEVERHGYWLGHTGNYLAVKVPVTKAGMPDEITVVLNEVAYPYMIGEVKKVSEHQSSEVADKIQSEQKLEI